MTDSSENWGLGVERHTPFSSSVGERKIMNHFVVSSISRVFESNGTEFAMNNDVLHWGFSFVH
jgi:hypothetical protein